MPREWCSVVSRSRWLAGFAARAERTVIGALFTLRCFDDAASGKEKLDPPVRLVLTKSRGSRGDRWQEDALAISLTGIQGLGRLRVSASRNSAVFLMS